MKKIIIFLVIAFIVFQALSILFGFVENQINNTPILRWAFSGSFKDAIIKLGVLFGVIYYFFIREDKVYY